jgi:Fe-Mn family superoxide dismutase
LRGSSSLTNFEVVDAAFHGAEDEMASKRYEAKQFPRLKGLQGISDPLLQNHLELYAGYVKNTNAILDELQKLRQESRAKGTDLAYAELTRRLGFEENGILLHELYFQNLAPTPDPLEKSGKLAQVLAQSFGDTEGWLADFKAIATMRGVGWAIAYQNPSSGLITNHWVELHQGGHPAGHRPIVVLDAWEHAFVPDYKPTERAKYIDAYFKNVDWKACEARLVAR